MPKLDSIIHNFGNHLTSGLCRLIETAYDACEKNDFWNKVQLELLGEALPEGLVEDQALASEVIEAKEKFRSILMSESNMVVDDVDSVRVIIDYLPNEPITKERKAFMAEIPVWYGYNPVYDCEIKIVLKNGVERVGDYRDIDRR